MSNRKSKQQIFFLTKLDIVKMMSIVKRRIPIEYVLMGSFDSEIVRREKSTSSFSLQNHHYQNRKSSKLNLEKMQFFSFRITTCDFPTAIIAYRLAFMHLRTVDVENHAKEAIGTITTGI